MPFSKTGKSRRGVRVPVTLGTVPSEGWPSPGPGLYKKKKKTAFVQTSLIIICSLFH